MNVGDRGGRALVDVGRPLVERRDGRLEGEPGDDQRDAGQQQRVGRGRPCRPIAVGDRVELHRAGGAVDQRQAVEQRRRADRPDHEVLEPGLERRAPAQLGGAQHVERDRQQLDADEQRDQVLGAAASSDHAGDRAEQHRVVLAVAGLARGARARSDSSTRDQAGDVDEHRDAERERVARQRALDDRLLHAGVPDPDRQADRGEQRDRRQQRHQHAAARSGRGTGRPSARRSSRRRVANSGESAL